MVLVMDSLIVPGLWLRR